MKRKEPISRSKAQSRPATLPAEKPWPIPPLACALLLTAACLLPFVNKAFHMDDTLFLRAAAQIHNHPLDFYGGEINWYENPTPLSQVFQNPPLASYYLALLAWIGGWREWTLHLGFLVPALAAVWGTFALARSWCRQPLLATLVVIATPAFFVSATDLMCDVLLLAFWVWSLAWFERGLQRNQWLPFLVSGVLAALAFLTKYPGFALVPLLAAWGVIRLRRAGTWILAPLIPLAVAAGYELLTRRLYGNGLLTHAVSYAAITRVHSPVRDTVVGLAFAGGCLLPILLYGPRCLPRWALVASLLVAAALLPALLSRKLLWADDQVPHWLAKVQFVLFVAGGIQIALLSILEWRSRRDPVSLLLLFWLAGVFVFAVFVNWTLNARTLLPMAPAFAILLARRLESVTLPVRRLLWPLAVVLPATLLVAKADFDFANANRAVATDFCSRYAGPGRTLWFQGHWGFQFYMERGGGQAWNFADPQPRPGDLIAVPPNNSNVYGETNAPVRVVESRKCESAGFVAAMDHYGGAGFYDASWGPPLPFVFAPVPPSDFRLMEIVSVPQQKVPGTEQR